MKTDSSLERNNLKEGNQNTNDTDKIRNVKYNATPKKMVKKIKKQR